MDLLGPSFVSHSSLLTTKGVDFVVGMWWLQFLIHNFHRPRFSTLQYFFSIYYGPYSSCTCLLTFFKHYYYNYDWNIIQGWIQGSSKGSVEPLFCGSNRPLTSLDKLLKCYLNLGNLKSVYYHTIRFYNKTVTIISLYWKLCHTVLITISASKSNYHCFGGFLQVQYYWWVNICY